MTIVIVSLWQRDVVLNLISTSQVNLAQLIKSTPEITYSSKNSIEETLKVIPGKMGKGCINAAFFSGDKYYQSNGTEAEFRHFKDVVRLAAASPSKTVHYYGLSWNIFGPAKKYVIVAQQIKYEETKLASIGILLDLSYTYKRIIQKQKIILVYFFINVLILSIIGLFRMVKIIIRPIENLVRISDAYTIDELEDVFSLDRDGHEFQKLSGSLNEMIRRIENDRKKLKSMVKELELSNVQLKESRKEVITAERMAAIGVLSAGLAHEIGNPLGIVQGYLELLEHDNIKKEDRCQFVKRGVGELQRVDTLIRQLLIFSKSTDSKQDVGLLRKILVDLKSRISVMAEMQSIEYIEDINICNEVHIYGETALMQVLFNCVLNAIYAINKKDNDGIRSICLKCSRHKDENGDQDNIKITVEDSGIGISNDALTKVFDPFFTTKEPGKGTGLGLSVSYALVEAINGKIWVESGIGKGTIFHIVVPVYQEHTLRK